MHREIITSNGCLVGNDFEILIQKGIIEETKDSKTHKRWNEFLDKSGLYDPDSNVEAKDLFALLKQVFDLKYCQTKDISFRTGYVFSVDFERSIKHIDSSRAYSTANAIYIDELLVSVLFEYLAVYYLWAAKKEEPDVYAFCFQKALYLLEGCYRKGNLDNDESKSEIIDMISKHCKSNAAVVISDLYWCSLAFAMSHELAHIYHGHNRFLCENKQDEWAIEYAADKNGYEVILELISKKYLGVPSPFHEVFENYAYTAPEILLLFYEDLFYVGQWLHGELPGDTHPDFKSRIDRLLEQSNSSDYTFDTEDGNAVLSSYWEISDLFREELLLKLVHGKLEIIKRKGENTTMSGNGYEEAYAFDEAMCNVVRQM